MPPKEIISARLSTGQLPIGRLNRRSRPWVADHDFYLVQGWHEGKEVFNHLGDYINEHRYVTLTTPAPVDRVWYMFARLLKANLESNLGYQAELRCDLSGFSRYHP